VRFWDVTDGNPVPLSHSQVRIVWVDAGQGRTRPVDGPDLALIGAGRIEIDFIAPAGYQAVGPTRASVPADFAGTLDFSARRVVAGDESGVSEGEQVPTPTGATGTTGTTAPGTSTTPVSPSPPGPQAPAEEVPPSTPEPEEELDLPVVPPLPRPPASIPLVPGD
jgi:hypothetical protein